MLYDKLFEQIDKHKSQLVIDLYAGTIAGVGNILLSHPMDTVKVRMQCSTCSILQVIKKTYQNEGLLAFYKGMKFPLISVPIMNACVFTTYAFCKRIIQKDQNISIPYWKTAICGGVAGFTSAFLATPIDLAKCRLQVQKQQIYRGPFDCMRKIIRAEGITGLFRGLYVAQIRLIRGFTVQFPTFEAMKDLFCWAKSQKQPSHLDIFISGGVAGVACWTVGYPQDVVKTILQLQTNIKPEERLYKTHPWINDGGYTDCYNKIKQQEGWKGLWRGFSACTIRAFYANAIGFYTYEVSRAYFVRINNGSYSE